MEVKNFFDNSTPAMEPSTESSSQKVGLPTANHHRHCRERERRRNLHTKSYKANHERLCSARLARHDQAAKLLDKQRLQAVKTHKPTLVNFNHF
jgi:hypothetical protein